MTMLAISDLVPGDVFVFAKDTSPNPPLYRMTDTNMADSRIAIRSDLGALVPLNSYHARYVASINEWGGWGRYLYGPRWETIYLLMLHGY